MTKNRLRELRREFNMTQDELGKILGVVRSTISDYERNRLDINSTTLKKMSKLFDAPIDYILGNSDQRYIDLEDMDVEKQLKQLINYIETSEHIKFKNVTQTKEKQYYIEKYLKNSLSYLEEIAENSDNKD